MLSVAGQGGEGRHSGPPSPPARPSYDALYRAYGPPRGRLVRLLMRMGCEREEAADIAQEALARLAMTAGDARNPEAWVTRTATNLWLSRCRHAAMRTRRLPALAAGQGGPGGPVADDVATAVTDRMAVAMGVDGLEPVHRAILVLRYFEDYRVREIAEILDKPEGTVKWLGQQAEAALRRALKDRP